MVFIVKCSGCYEEMEINDDVVMSTLQKYITKRSIKENKPFNEVFETGFIDMLKVNWSCDRCYEEHTSTPLDTNNSYFWKSYYENNPED